MHALADTLHAEFSKSILRVRRGGELGKMVDEFWHLEGARTRAGGGTGSLVDHCPTKTCFEQLTQEITCHTYLDFDILLIILCYQLRITVKLFDLAYNIHLFD